ncbi:hypothetical protein [Actinomadura sp. SCN-SB]|uniref:hypothetical protein n=1 Tax=Actinomadura sp. SCN-SB TaxID=3373092 RepID=UPI003751D788
MGKAARRRQEDRKARAAKAKATTDTTPADPRARAEAAVPRLLRLNAPGKVSLAGAYAFGYGALGMAQTEHDGPDWFHELDPLDTLFLGTAWPKNFLDEREFANARDAWLDLLRGTVHWSGIERFVREVIDASAEHDLPVDEGELMLLVAGRLENARLDQRKLPRDLLPEHALANTRAVFGPPVDLPLPHAPAGIGEQITRFWASTEIDLPHDGTPADALREGVHLLAAAGMPARQDPAMLLPALYLALVAADDESLDDTAERAAAWSLGLHKDSPLISITDILLVAPQRDLSIDEVLGHLFAVPAFTQQVRPQDRLWHTSPGRALIDLAFELGYSQVVTRDGKVVRMSPDAAAMLKAQYRRFEDKFGRPPAPDEPIFFDPDADTPQVPSLVDVENESVSLLEHAGLAPAWIYAYQQTGGLLPSSDGSFPTDRDAQEWQEAVDRYVKLHGGEQPDHEANLRILNTIQVLTDLQTAATDPEYAAALLQGLGDDEGSGDLLRSYLTHMAAHLTEQLRTDPSVQNRAHEHARAWAGAQLAERVRNAASASDGQIIGDAEVLLAVAVATLP